MQNRNFILFIVVSVAIVAGWAWLQNRIWPPPERAKDKDKAKTVQFDKKKYGLAAEAAQIVARASEGIVGSLGGLLGDLGKLPPLPPLRGDDLPKGLRTALRLTQPQPWPIAAGLLAEFFPRPLVQETIDRVTLGGEGYHLQATLTTRGAGVEKIVLTRFEGVNWIGRSTDKDLELVPEDRQYPSFLMYHYPSPGATQPVLTLGQQVWKLEKNAPGDKGIQEVVFTTRAPAPYTHLLITKTYTLEKQAYHLGLRLEISNDRDSDKDEPTPFRYQLAGSHGIPIEGEWYTGTFRTGVVGMVDSNNTLWREVKESMYVSIREGSEKIPLAGSNLTAIQYAGVMNQYFASVIAVDDQQPGRGQGRVDWRKILAWARVTNETQEIKGKVLKVDVKEGRLQFQGADGLVKSYDLLPRAKQHILNIWSNKHDGEKAVLSYYVLPDGKHVATWIRQGQTPRPYFDDITVRVNSEPVDLKPGGTVAHQFLLYHGPVKTMLLGQFSGDKSVPSELVTKYTDTLNLRTLTDYNSDNWFGRFSRTIRFTDLLILVTKFMHTLLYWLQWLVPIPGLSIILLTVVVRGAMFPISRKQALFSIRMQELAPELKKLGEKYKNDPQGKTQAMMELYRKHKIHPLASCFPLLLQLPIFLGLYYALQESVMFRLAGFLWIESLAAPDMFLWWGQGIPWISDPDSQGGIFYLGPYLNVLPIIAVVFMIVQQKIMTPPPTDDDQARQQSMMRIMMGVMGIMFYKVPSGLCIYFISSSLWGLAERRLLPKKPDPNKLPPPAPAKQAPANPKSKGKGPSKKVDDTALQKVKNWWENVLKQAQKK